MDSDQRTDPPEWWEWPLALTPHLEARMEERGFSEVEMRTMLSRAARIAPARHPGRFVAVTRHRGVPWNVVLEPDEIARVIYVVTAFPRG